MLVIRKAQMRVLGQLTQRRFERRIEARLRLAFPRETRDRTPVEFIAFIRHGIEQAASYGIAREIDVVRYIECMIQYGADFDRRLDWARDILSAAGVTGRRKIDHIDAHEEFVLAGR